MPHALCTPGASLALAPSCTSSILSGAIHSNWPPQAAHHQLQCLFFLLLLSPSPVDTHQMSSSKGKLLQCGQTYDKVTPPIPIHWRDDPSQEVRALPQNFLHSANTPNCILCHLLESLGNLSKVHSPKLSFLPVFFLKNPPFTAM